MFTLYIHCLEVLAMHPDGASVKTIVEMGCEWSKNKVHSALQSLMDEGYVTCDDSGRVNIWQMTEKALEYVETVARKYHASHIMDDIADYVESGSENAIAPSQDAITEVSETPLLLKMDNAPTRTVTELFEGMTKVMGGECPYCERAYTHSMSRRDDTVFLSLIHQCKDRSYDLDWSVNIHTDSVIDNFSDLIPF